MMFDFLPLRNNIKDLADEITALRAQIEERKRQHEFLTVAPRAPADVADLVDELIVANAASWAERLRAALEPLQRKPLLEVDPRKPFAVLSVVKPDTMANLWHLETALFAIFGDPIRRAVRAEIMSWDSSGAGPLLVKRRTELAKLDAEIEELEQREQQLVDEARAAGIRL